MLVVYRNKSSLYCYFLLLLLGSILESLSSVAAEVAEQTCSADGTCTTTTTSSSASSSSCVDVESACGYWADVGECDINPGYMHVNCRKSCDICSNHDDSAPQVDGTILELGGDFGVPQALANDDFRVGQAATSARILESRQYLKTTPMKKGLKEICRNEHEHCTTWALAGECVANAKYMKKSCAPACLSCDYMLVENRCPIDPNAPNAWGPGDLDAMFSRLSSEPFLSEYSVEVLSSPKTTGGPWVITMENVVSEDEAKRLIELGHTEGYERSSDVGAMRPDGTFESNVNEGRTSTNAWCQNECYQDEMALRVAERLSNITGISEPNSEYLQLLKYDVGQKYQVHHDYIEHHLTRQPGVRIMTLYLYLNDVEAGGGTNFDELDVTVLPKRGRALLWPSVLNEAPDQKDGRTTHQALPVEAGIKYGANAWFHQRDFKTANKEGCH